MIASDLDFPEDLAGMSSVRHCIQMNYNISIDRNENCTTGSDSIANTDSLSLPAIGSGVFYDPTVSLDNLP